MSGLEAWRCELPSGVMSVLNVLHGAGHEAYIVGGCVRDLLLRELSLRDVSLRESPLCERGANERGENLIAKGLGVPPLPSDWDITTSALPHEVRGLFSRTIPTGLKHGTISVVYEGAVYEVTTFRTEGTYSNSRSPDSVEFVRDLSEDLKRRDFSINALAYAPHTGLVDRVGGLRDLCERRIVCVGEARTRFGEDALRILRAMRFAATLGFEIEEGTKAAMFSESAGLKAISLERVRVELEKLLCGEGAGAVLGEYGEILSVILPEMRLNRGKFYFSYAALAREGGRFELGVWEMKNLAWVAFARDFVSFEGDGGTGVSLTLLKRLRFDKRSLCFIEQVLGCLELDYKMSEYELRRAFVRLIGAKLGRRNALGVLGGAYLLRCMGGVAQESGFEKRILRVAGSSLPLSVSELEINGNDVLGLAQCEGREIGVIFQRLLDEVLQDRLPNAKEALLARAGELLEAK